MMVRSFLRIYQFACAWFVALSMLIASESATAHEVRPALDKFMAAYAHDLAQRLGPGSHIEYTVPAAADANTQICATQPTISARDLTQALSRVTLSVSCGNQWSIYVPIDLDVHIPVVVAIKPLPNGAIIGADDVELSQLDVSQLAGTYLTSLGDAIGMGVKRPITPGRAILSQQLEPPLLIRRGDAVVINAEAGILAVKMTGTALADGRRGEQIRIKNQTSSRIVDARVVGPGQVSVQM